MKTILILLILITGCSLDSFRKKPAASNTGEPETLTYVPALSVDIDKMTRTPSGLLYLDRKTGEGATATKGSVVRVGYSGWLPDGSLFDRSGQGDPIEFVLGQGRVISGWEEGIEGMKVGGRRLLVIRPSLAYGSESPGAGVPPNATLVFDVTLDGVTP